MKSSRIGQITIALTALTVVGLVSAPPAAAATLYSLLDLGTLGGDSSRANGINNLGQVVGSSTIASGDTRAFRTEPNSPINGATDNLGTLPGDRSSVGLGINDLGQVVGGAEYYNSNGSNFFPAYPFAPSGGAFRTAPNSPINPATDNLGDLGLVNSAVATGINNLGQVVGTSGTYFNYYISPSSGFRTAPNSPINRATDTIGREVTSISSANGINDLGQVIGLYGPFPSYRTAPNSRTINIPTDDLGSLGGIGTQANAINNLGQVVGGSSIPGDRPTYHAFRTAANSAINPATDDLGTLGGTFSTAYAINNLGQVVGSSGTTSGDTHAFLYDDGSLLDLNNLIPADSGFVLSNARGINDLGQIVGDGVINGQTHAFLATPVPEPDSNLYTLAFGVLTVGFVLKRPRK